MTDSLRGRSDVALAERVREIADRLESYHADVARLAGENGQVNAPLSTRTAQLVVDLRDAAANSDGPSPREEAAILEGIAFAQAAERLREALAEVREVAGAVCPQYETCDHAVCRASYSAWAIADEALGPEQVEAAA